MTGAFLRVQRDGKWTNIEIEHLTEEEMDELFLYKTPEEIIQWLSLTCSVLRLADESICRMEKMIEGIQNEKH